MSILYDDKGLADTCVCDGCGRTLISTNNGVYDLLEMPETLNRYEPEAQSDYNWEQDLPRYGWCLGVRNTLCPECMETAIDYWLTRKEGNNE